MCANNMHKIKPQFSNSIITEYNKGSKRNIEIK